MEELCGLARRFCFLPSLKLREGWESYEISGVDMKFIRNDPALKERRRELRRKQTDAERAFWTSVRNRQFYGLKFFRQYSFGSYILDFLLPGVENCD